VVRREELFYHKMKVNNFQELNDRIKEIEKKYDVLLPNGEIMQYVKNTYSFVNI
jgi:tetrahydromethanopterin S-methyltransferase subunit G